MKRTVQSVLLALAASAAAGCGGPQYPNCQNDSQCHEGEFCVNGTCQQCRPDESDCPSGQRCVQGRCETPEGYCSGNSDCPDGQECRNNQCVVRSTATNETDLDNGGCQLSPIYFEYDSSDLDPRARDALSADAQCIQQREMSSVTLVGHCDPRGTEEYNLALGERRAQTVRTYLGNLGVDTGRVNTTSMGEEMAEDDESTWPQARRVDVTGQ
jgi:peptidoglycan-associated lipoprotein